MQLIFTPNVNVFHVLPQTDKNRHISRMGKDINKLYGEKLDIIIGNELDSETHSIR